MKAIVGRKVGMTQVFATDGQQYAVTVVEVLPNIVSQIKTVETDGYNAVQVAYDEKREKSTNKCEVGHAKKANIKVGQHYREFRFEEVPTYQLGDKIEASIFQAGDVVDVIGVSKGKGYSGTVKRWGHKIGPKGHGSGYHRGQGSFANNGRCNNRVIPGKKMSGHHGFQSATILNLVVVEANAEKGYILIKGALPGAKKSLVTIREAVKAQHGNKEVIKTLVNNAPKAE